MFSFNMYINKKGTLKLNYKACENYKISSISLADDKDPQVTSVDEDIYFQYISEDKNTSKSYNFPMGQF